MPFFSLDQPFKYNNEQYLVTCYIPLLKHNKKRILLAMKADKDMTAGCKFCITHKNVRQLQI